MEVQPTDDLLDGGWFTTEELAGMLGVDSSTLRRWRTAQPPAEPLFVCLSSRVTLYSAHDVRLWLATAATGVPAGAHHRRLEEVNSAFEQAAGNSLAGVLSYSTDPSCRVTSSATPRPACSIPA